MGSNNEQEFHKNLLRIFDYSVQEEFSFLTNVYGFNGPHKNYQPNEMLYVNTILFKGRNIAIELSLDNKDQTVDCYIVRLVDGELPDGFITNSSGQRVRFHLSSWVRSRGVKDYLFTKVTGLTFQERVPIDLKDYAQTLQHYARSVLEDKPDVFLDRN